MYEASRIREEKEKLTMETAVFLAFSCQVVEHYIQAAGCLGKHHCTPALKQEQNSDTSQTWLVPG